MAGYAEKVQHLQRWSTQTILQPRVACTIVWQPWAIKSATPTALKHIFRNIIPIVACGKTRQITRWNVPIHFTFYYQQYQYHQLTSKQLAPFPRLTTPLSLRRGAGGEASYALHYFILYYQPYHHHNWFTTQLGTSCSFDSPGLASDSEVYPGSFAVRGNNAVGVVPFIYCYFITTFHAENVQHLRRWPQHYTHNPG